MKTISKNQYLQLVGLLALSKNHMKSLEGIHEAARAITRDNDRGHTCDAVYDLSRSNADELLKRLKITVRKK